MSPTTTGTSSSSTLRRSCADHRLGQLDAGHRDAALGQRNRDAAPCRSPAPGPGRRPASPARKSTAGSSTSGANISADASSYRCGGLLVPQVTARHGPTASPAERRASTGFRPGTRARRQPAPRGPSTLVVDVGGEQRGGGGVAGIPQGGRVQQRPHGELAHPGARGQLAHRGDPVRGLRVRVARGRACTGRRGCARRARRRGPRPGCCGRGRRAACRRPRSVRAGRLGHQGQPAGRHALPARVAELAGPGEGPLERSAAAARARCRARCTSPCSACGQGRNDSQWPRSARATDSASRVGRVVEAPAEQVDPAAHRQRVGLAARVAGLARPAGRASSSRATACG